MPRYPKYTTTIIGAYSVPDWFEPLDRLVAVGQLSLVAMADAQFRVAQAAILDQELIGIDVITGGEMHRRTGCLQEEAEVASEGSVEIQSGRDSIVGQTNEQTKPKHK
jgi:hypothetical protein